MSRNQPNQLFLSKIYVASLFGCHTECTLYHRLHTGDYTKNEAKYSDINTLRTGAFKLFKCTFPGSKQFKSTSFILCFFKYL